jgi:hypothetical protein
VLEREIDGKLQVIAAMRLFRFSRLIQLSAGSSLFSAVSYESFESGCKEIDPACGRLICWISFSAGAEILAKGVCLLRDVEVRTGKQGATDFGTLGDLIGKNGKKGKLGHLADAVQANDQQQQLVMRAYKELAAIRNRDAHAYIPNVRANHFEAVSTTFVPCFNLLTSWLPYDFEDIRQWNDEAPQFIAVL